MEKYKNTIKSEARRDVSGNLASRDYHDEVVNFLSLFFYAVSIVLQFSTFITFLNVESTC